MANRLADEKSPYLLQHADNPVDWHPWGQEALDLAMAQDRPIFLSIGYATCHWCHVMAHESFEDQEVADLLNREFVPIKVDREERPDLDGVYMAVCQALTGRGGWPLSVFLTPQGKPFYAGTYFPKHTRQGMPGFVEILTELAKRWNSPDRSRMLQAGDQIVRALEPKAAGKPSGLGVRELDRAYEGLTRMFDEKNGGFGNAPKFPTPHHLTFLLRWHLRHPESRALNMAETTLMNMWRGGMYDQVGMGFHRYSVDAMWLVPHFEKMLYDQAMLAMAYVEAFRLTGKAAYAEAARQIFRYVLRDMTSPEGGFYSAEDADSEGQEGLFYCWTPEQVQEALGPELGGLFCAFYNIVPGGNFEHGLSIPHITASLEEFAQKQGWSTERVAEELEEARERLFELRSGRVRPLLDDKVITSWNGLMIAALAMGHQALGDEEYLRAAEKAADFIEAKLSGAQGRLHRRWRQGHVSGHGFLDDYAFYAWGLIELYEAGFDPARLGRARQLMQLCQELFWDGNDGGFFYTPSDGEALIFRDKEIYDGAVPSGNSVAALNLLRLGRMLGEAELEQRADELLKAFAELVSRQPVAYTQLMNALDFATGQGREIVLVGEPDSPDLERMLDAVRGGFRPNDAVLLKPLGSQGGQLEELAPFCGDMAMREGRATAYVCQGHACQNPLNDPDKLDLG